MARAALTLLGCAIALGCGGARTDGDRPLVLDEGWAETPLDAELARLACGPSNDCGDVCRVRAHIVEAGGGSRDVEHRISGDARLVVTLRSGGSLSLRAAIAREAQQLHAVLELEHRGALDAGGAIRALARPGSSLPEDAHVVRTYERSGESAYTLHERGGPTLRVRGERREERDGEVHAGNIRAPADTGQTRASIEGRTRVIDSVRVQAELGRSRITAIEQLDEHGRVVRIRRRFEADWAEDEEELELERGQDDAPIAITSHRRGRSERRVLERGEASRASSVELDRRGRPTTYRRLRESGVEEVVAITRDSEGRVLSIAWNGPNETAELRIARDARGRVVSKTDVSGNAHGASTTTLSRVLDAGGRLIRAERAVRAREDGAASEIVSSVLAAYEYGDRCPADVIVPDELDLLPSLDERFDYVPF